MNPSAISVRQFTIIVFLYTIGTTILIIPAGLAATARQDAWIASVLGIALNILIVLLYNLFAKRFPGTSIIQHYELVYGKWLGKLFSLSFISYAFVGATTVLFYLGNFINTQVMPDTPIQAVNILFIAIVVMGLRLGLETVARTGEILFPWILFLFFILVVSLIPEVDLQKARPVLEVGPASLFKGAVFLSATSALPFIMLFMIFPVHVLHFRKARRGFWIGTLAGGLYIVLITFFSVGVLGAEISERQTFPSFSLAKRINIGDFFARVEIIIAAIWFITVYFKMVFYFYGCVVGLAQIFKLSDYRPLVLPMGMIIVVYSLVVYPNVAYANEFDRTVWIPYILTLGLVIPFVTWVAGIWRRRMNAESVSNAETNR